MPKKWKGTLCDFLPSELLKSYIRILKTLHQNFEMLYPQFENVISELWKRYIRTFKTSNAKRYIRTLKLFEQMSKKKEPFRVN